MHRQTKFSWLFLASLASTAVLLFLVEIPAVESASQPEFISPPLRRDVVVAPAPQANDANKNSEIAPRRLSANGTAEREFEPLAEPQGAHGTVVDESGAPIEGAKVHFWYLTNSGCVPNPEAHGHTGKTDSGIDINQFNNSVPLWAFVENLDACPFEILTDATGRFDWVPEDRTRLVAGFVIQKSGFVAAVVRDTSSLKDQPRLAPDAPAALGTFILQRAGGVKLTFVDTSENRGVVIESVSSGAPVETVSKTKGVSYYNISGSRHDFKNGLICYESVAAGPVQFMISTQEGYYSSPELWIQPGRVETLQLKTPFAPAGSVVQVNVETGYGAPLPDLEYVTLVNVATGETSHPVWEGSGYFFCNTKEGKYELRFDDPRFVAMCVPISAPQTWKECVELMGNCTIDIEVYNQSTGARIGEFEADLKSNNRNWDSLALPEANQFIRKVPAFAYELRIEAAGFESGSVKLAALVPGETRKVKIYLSPDSGGACDELPRIFGRVINSPDPEYTYVDLIYSKESADFSWNLKVFESMEPEKSGAFEFTNLKPGVYGILSHTGGRYAAAGPFVIDLDTNIESVDLTFTKPAGLKGKIQFNDRENAIAQTAKSEGRLGTIRAQRGEASASAEIEPDGSYIIDELGGGEYDIYIKPPSGSASYHFGMITLHEGETVARDFDARHAGTASANLEITVDGERESARALRVEFIFTGDLEKETYDCNMNDQGRVKLNDLPAGKFKLMIYGRDERWVYAVPGEWSVGDGKSVDVKCNVPMIRGTIELVDEKGAGLAAYYLGYQFSSGGVTVEAECYQSKRDSKFELMFPPGKLTVEFGIFEQSQIIEWTERGPLPQKVVLRRI
ncbi:MAG: hypothetical protein ACKVS6_14190 [Planctomycetota bacterium]